MHINKFFITLLVALLMCSATVKANVKKINISKGQVVTQEVITTPGFSAMFEVPTEIVSFSIADQTSFVCDKMPPDNNKLLCKPLTTQDVLTNLVITTVNNEFNIILSIKNDGNKYPFKYVFYDSAQKNQTSYYADIKATNNSSTDLLNNILNDYDHQKCSSKESNDYLYAKCVEKVRIGTDQYVKFTLTNRNKSKVEIINCNVLLQTLGGFTGVVIKNEKPPDTKYILKNENLSPNEETIGVIKMPNIKGSKDQRLVFSINTDIGKEADLEIAF